METWLYSTFGCALRRGAKGTRRGGIPLAEPLIVPASKIVRRRYKGGVNLLMGSPKGGGGKFKLKLMLMVQFMVLLKGL